MDELKAELMECVKEMPIEEVKECLAEHAMVEDVDALAAFLKKGGNPY